MDVSRLFIFVLFLPSVTWAQSKTAGLHILNQGSSLSVEKESDFLVSPNGTYSCGFYEVGENAFCFSIWVTNSLNKTVVWMANRDKPVNGKQASLSLHSNGNLILADADDSIVWSTNKFTGSRVEARLLETGNLVLVENSRGELIWQSFDFPADTLLPLQPLVKNTTLVSMRSAGTYLSGFYNMKFDDDNIIDLLYNDPSFSSIYWPNPGFDVFRNGRNRYNSTRFAVLRPKGNFRSSDNWNFNASDYGVGPKRRLTLDYDGILRLYRLDELTGLWKIMWFPDDLNACLVHGLCGEYGVCIYNPLPTCICPSNFTCLFFYYFYPMYISPIISLS